MGILLSSHGFKRETAARVLEFPLQLLTIGVAFGLIGPGSYSLDTFYGIALPGALLFFVLAIICLLVGIVGLIISRQASTTPSEVKSPD